MDGTERVLLGRRGGYRQQRLGARDEARRSQSKKQPLRWKSAWRQNWGYPAQPDQHLPPARYRPATVSHAAADEPIAGAQKRTAQLAPRPVETASDGTTAFVAPVLHIPLTLLLPEHLSAAAAWICPANGTVPTKYVYHPCRRQSWSLNLVLDRRRSLHRWIRRRWRAWGRLHQGKQFSRSLPACPPK